MKIGYKDFWVEFSIKDVSLKLIEAVRKYNNKEDITSTRIFTIALIDDRYDMTRYIIDYGKIECSLEELDWVDFSHLYQLEGPIILQPTLKDLFIGEAADILIESMGPLYDYEQDTPELNTFDIVIKL